MPTGILHSAAMPSDVPLLVELKTLKLLEPFRIAHGVSSTRQVLRLSQGEALSEAPFVPYYEEQPEEATEWLRGRQEGSTASEAEGPRVARLALDLLRLDQEGKRRGCSLAALHGIAEGQTPPGCRSLGIPEDMGEFRDRVHALAATFEVIKLKLGSGSTEKDEAIVAIAREAAPNARLLVDVNGGWSPEEAARLIPRLARWHISLVEQPIHHQLGLAGWQELRQLLPSSETPLFADESAQTAEDVEPLHGLVNGINVKLLKCGSFDGALRMIRAARLQGMQVLVGCMIESSLAVTAAAHLASLADWIDLDGHFYVEDDFVGLTYDQVGKLCLPSLPGIAAVPRP